MTTALRVKENWKTTCRNQQLRRSSPQGLSPPPSESPAPTLNSWQVAVEGTPPLMRGESDIVAHSIFELLCQKVLLSWYRFLSSNHRYQFQSMTTKIKLNKEARRTKQKGAKQPQPQVWEGEGKQRKTFVSSDMLVISGPGLDTLKKFTPYLYSPVNGNIFSLFVHLKDNTDESSNSFFSTFTYNQIRSIPRGQRYPYNHGDHAKFISPSASCTGHHWPRCQPLESGTGIQSCQGWRNNF